MKFHQPKAVRQELHMSPSFVFTFETLSTEDALPYGQAFVCQPAGGSVSPVGDAARFGSRLLVLPGVARFCRFCLLSSVACPQVALSKRATRLHRNAQNKKLFVGPCEKCFRSLRNVQNHSFSLSRKSMNLPRRSFEAPRGAHKANKKSLGGARRAREVPPRGAACRRQKGAL